MSVATEGTQGFEDKELPAIQDASEFRDIELASVREPRTTDLVPDSQEHPTSKRERESIRYGALVSNDGRLTEETAVQETAARTYNAFTVTALPGAGTFPGEYVQLLGNDVKRQRARLSNGHATDPVMIGPLDQVQSGSGFLLPAGQLFEPEVQGAIYACIPVGGTAPVPVGVWAEVNA